MKLKKFKKTWKKHRHFVISGGQIITILGIIAGIFTTYWQVHQNTSDIKNVNQWVGHNLGDKTENITQLKTDFTNLQSKVELQGEELDLFMEVLTNAEPETDKGIFLSPN